MSKEIFLCAISNISSGSCNEDCAFCAQSSKYKANIDRYLKKDIDLIVKEAKEAKKNKAVGFCLVTSGRELDFKKLEFVCEVAKKIKKEVGSLHLIACNGLADRESLKELKKCGIDSYNHNLETSKEYYKKICTTHDWEERFQTCINVKEAGLKLCSGGIFGMGESLEDRKSFLKSLKELDVDSIPINFFHPNPSLPLPFKVMQIDEALLCIREVREFFPNKRVMVAGGREITFKERQKEIFKAGADSIVIGDYLTTKGAAAKRDLLMIEELGLKIAKQCNGK